MLTIVLLFIAQSLLDAGSGDAWKTLKNSDMSSDMLFSLGRSRAIAGSGRIAMKKMRQRKQTEQTVSAFEKNYETIEKPISMSFRMMYAASERSFVSNVGVRRSFRFSRITMLGVAKRIIGTGLRNSPQLCPRRLVAMSSCHCNSWTFYTCQRI